MTRALRIGGRYRRDADRLSIVAGSEHGRAVARTIAALLAAETVPGAGDFEARLPPTRRAHVRRVPDRNLGLGYGFTASEVTLVTVTGEPPVPIDDEYI